MSGETKLTKEKAIETARLFFKNNKNEILKNENIVEFQNKKDEINLFLNTNEKNPLIKEYIKLYTEAERNPNTLIGKMSQNMRKIAAEQEVMKMAAELCEDEKDKQALLNQYNKLNSSPAMKDYGLYIEGLKFYAGMTDEVSKEVKDFFQNNLRLPFFTAYTDNTNTYETYRDSAKEKNEKEKLEAEYGKEGLELIEKYQHHAAKAKARELFSKQQLQYRSLELEFFRDELNNIVPEKERPYPFTGRKTPLTFCVGMLLKEGKSLEEILEPGKLIQDKMRLGDAYLYLVRNKKTREYGEKMHECAEAVIKGIKDYIRKYKKELKTEDDLAMHASKLGMLCSFCSDFVQELPKCSEYVNDSVKVETNGLVDAVGKYVYGAGTGITDAIPYNPYKLNKTPLTNMAAEQMAIKMMLEEIQKEEPDIEKNCLDNGECAKISHQLDNMEELDSLFVEDVNLDSDAFDANSAEMLASMQSTDFIEKNKLTVEHAKMPLVAQPKQFKSVAIAGIYEVEKDSHVGQIVRKNGEPLITPDLPVMIHLTKLNPKLRGDRKSNSMQFNALTDACDKTNETPDKLGKNTVDFLKEMRVLKKSAVDYILAKRAQKGYSEDSELNVPNREVDKNMLGKGDGASIFTTRGKVRYEFALKLVEEVIRIEEEIKKKDPDAYKAAEEAEIKEPEKDDPGMDR